MTNIIVIDPSGKTREKAATCGASLMEALRDLGAVDAVCGGGASCGTCAVRIEASWHQRLPTPGEAERVLLDGLDYNAAGNRLSCQILVGEAMEGMTVHLLPT